MLYNIKNYLSVCFAYVYLCSVPKTIRDFWGVIPVTIGTAGTRVSEGGCECSPLFFTTQKEQRYESDLSKELGRKRVPK